MLRRTATLTSKGQVTVPVEVRRLMGVVPHDKVTFVVDEDRVVRLVSATSVVEETAGVLATYAMPQRSTAGDEGDVAEQVFADEANEEVNW